MKRLIALTTILHVFISNCWCQCTSAPEFTEEEIVTCDEHVWLTTYPNLTSWNDNEAVSDSFLVSTSGVVNAASVVLDSSAVLLDGQLSYLNLGHGFDNVQFPFSMIMRFSLEPGFTNASLFATDEGLGYSGLSFGLGGLNEIGSSIGDGYGGGPGERRSKTANFDFEIGEWYTFVGVIRSATDHSLFINGTDLGGYYSGYGNGEVVDLGRPATIGYVVADSGPLTGQEETSLIKVDFAGFYDFDVSPFVESFDISCSSDFGFMDSPQLEDDALGWYDFEVENPFIDSSLNQPDIIAEGNVQSEVVLCACENSVEIEVTIQEGGCIDDDACNYDITAQCDDGSCVYPPAIELGEDITTCGEEVWLTTHPNLTSWNDFEAVSDSFLVSTTSVVNAAPIVFDSSAVLLDGQLSYLNLGHGFDNVQFPFSMIMRFSLEPGFTNASLFATDEGLGYSGLSFGLGGLNEIGSSIGDGYGGGPGERRSKTANFDFEIGEWYTFVGVIRSATDHSLFINGTDLGGYYSGYGNGEVVDLGRPATIGYVVADSGPLTGQEETSLIKVDFAGFYDFDVSPFVESFDISCSSDFGFMDSPQLEDDALGWYDFEVENPFIDSSLNQPDIIAEGNVQSEVVLCACENSVEIEVTIQEGGCIDDYACNYDSMAECDDGSCDYSCCPGPGCCTEGMYWDWELNGCYNINPSDSNFDGCVQLNDLLDLLTAYGNCAAEDSPWQCGDPLEHQGYDYETVQIGDQCWFAENLRTELYQNGDSIPMIYDNAAWLETEEGALCWFNNDSTSWGFPGFLYNGYSVADERGVCPNSWHVASDSDWIAVEISHGLSESEAQEYGQRGGSINLSQKMRDESWGQNQLGFAARRGGYRSYENGSFSGPLQTGAFWSNSNITTGYREFYIQWPGVARGEIGVSEGLSVRCIKNAE